MFMCQVFVHAPSVCQDCPCKATCVVRPLCSEGVRFCLLCQVCVTLVATQLGCGSMLFVLSEVFENTILRANFACASPRSLIVYPPLTTASPLHIYIISIYMCHSLWLLLTSRPASPFTGETPMFVPSVCARGLCTHFRCCALCGLSNGEVGPLFVPSVRAKCSCPYRQPGICAPQVQDRTGSRRTLRGKWPFSLPYRKANVNKRFEQHGDVGLLQSERGDFARGVRRFGARVAPARA